MPMAITKEHEPCHVEFRNVSKTYDGKGYSVKDLNLAVHRNEFMTFLGPSGSGKTTCLMMLAGFEASTSGEILIADKPVTRIAPHKRNIGVVFQNYALFPHMTVRENLAFPLSVRKYGKSEIEAKVARALEMVRLVPYAERMPMQLSGGQQQRVALARALIFDPVLVLMDEPLGALDKYLREKLQYEIKRIHAELGVTIIYVTHDQSEALTMSNRIAVFNNGGLQQLATPTELYEQPASAFVASFIGENNLIDCTFEGSDEHGSVYRSDCGKVLKVKDGTRSTSGARMVISVRPEKMSMSPHNGEHDNHLDATLDQYMYHGDHLRAIFKLDSGSTVMCKVTNPSLINQVVSGASVRIGWRSDECVAFPAA